MHTGRILLALALAAGLCGCTAPAPIPTPTPAATPAPAPTAAPTPALTPAAAQAPTRTGTPEQALSGVRLAEDVTPELLFAETWLAGVAEPDALLLDSAGIAAQNAANAKALAPDDRWFDLAAVSQTGTMPGARVRALLAADPALPGADCINGAPMPEGYAAALQANRNEAAVPEPVSLRFGVTVRRVNVRTQPTDDFAGGCGERIYDDLQQAELYWNEPVLVLHESADGAWLYILADRMPGWVPRESVACFATREAWLDWQSPADFLVVTGARMRLDHNVENTALSERELAMGTVLPLADAAEAPQSLYGRVPYGNYIAKMPLRGADGCVEPALVPVPVSAPVHRGWLTFTRRALLAQMFALQGQNYGWGGMQGANDCSGTVCQIYHCFGFTLPRNSKSLSMMDCATVELAGLPDAAARTDALAGLAPGAVLYMPGHIMLYLGQRGGHAYVLSAVGTFTDAVGGAAHRANTMTLTTLDVQRGGGKSWLQDLRCAKILG